MTLIPWVVGWIGPEKGPRRMEKKREGRSSDADNKQSVTRRVIILSLDVRVRLYASLPRVTCGIHYVWYVVEFARVSRVYASVCDNTRWLKNTTRPTCRSRKFLLALKTFRRDVLLVDNYARLSFFYFLLFFLLFSFFFFTPLSESTSIPDDFRAGIDDSHLLFFPSTLSPFFWITTFRTRQIVLR